MLAPTVARDAKGDAPEHASAFRSTLKFASFVEVSAHVRTFEAAHAGAAAPRRLARRSARRVWGCIGISPIASALGHRAQTEVPRVSPAPDRLVPPPSVPPAP